MLWTLLIGYVVVSQIAVIGVTLCGMIARCDDEPSVIEQLTPLQRIYAVAAAVLTGIFLGPLLLPLYGAQVRECWANASEESKYWVGVRNQQVRLSLDKLHPANISAELQEHFDAQSEAPLALGYRHLDDVWLKPQEPYCSKARIFLHPDGTTIAEVGCTMDIQYCELISYLDDGTVISTAATETNEFFEMIGTPEHGYFIQCLPDSEMDELLTKHEMLLHQIAKNTNTSVRTIPSDEWKVYFQFHNDRFGQLKFELDGGDPIDFDVIFPTSNNPAQFVSIDQRSDREHENAHFATLQD